MISVERIYENPEKSAEIAGLKYKFDETSCIFRKRKGKSFIYLTTDGAEIKNERILERVKALIVPPQWKDVKISSDKNTYMQATGIDNKGRKQYIYHTKWRAMRDLLNFYRMIDFGGHLGNLRSEIKKHFEEEGLTKEKVIAAILMLLDVLSIRIGNEQYKEENSTYGLTTMQDRHVIFDGDLVIFSFVGKSGKKHELKIKNQELAEIVKESKDIPGPYLFQYYDEEGNHRTISSQDVNDFIKKATGEHFTAKDFRTWAGTSEMYRLLKHSICITDKDYKRNLNKSLEKVANRLGNTKTVARKHYIHPELIRCFKDKEFYERVEDLNRRITREDNLHVHEVELILFLKDSLKQDLKTLIRPASKK